MNEESKSIRIMVYMPNMPAFPAEVPNELQVFQSFVGGNIEVVNLTDDLIIICNEEGILKNLLRNRMNIHGTFIVCRKNGEELDSLTDRDIDLLRRVNT